MPTFRVSIDVRSPEGLSDHVRRRLQDAHFQHDVHYERTAAAWARGEDEPEFLSYRYVYCVDAEDARHAVTKAHYIVGGEVGDISATPAR